MLWRVRGASLGKTHVLVHPIDAAPSGYRRQMKEHLDGGGRIVVITGYSDAAIRSSASVAGIAGMEVSARNNKDGVLVEVRGSDAVVLGPSGVRAWRKQVGKGSLVVVDAGDRLSREYLGHCFDMPDAEQKLVMNFIGGLICQANIVDPNGPQKAAACVFVR